MPGTARNFPMGRGSLAHNLTSYYQNQSMTAAARVTASPGAYAQVGLFNDAIDGSFLVVTGLSVWTSDAAGDVTMYRIQQIPPTFALTPGVPVNSFMPRLAGSLLTTAFGGAVGGDAIWRAGGGNTATEWPTDDPIVMLAPGWAFYTMPANINTTVSAAFRWVVIRSPDGQ